MSDIRLGDVIDDYCSRCRLVTNHSVVALLDHQVRKTRCRTCQHEHDYKHAKGGTRKTKPTAYEQVLATLNRPSLSPEPEARPKRARRAREA